MLKCRGAEAIICMNPAFPLDGVSYYVPIPFSYAVVASLGFPSAILAGICRRIIGRRLGYVGRTIGSVGYGRRCILIYKVAGTRIGILFGNGAYRRERRDVCKKQVV